MKKILFSCTISLLSMVAQALTITYPQPGLTLMQDSDKYVINFTMPDYEIVTEAIDPGPAPELFTHIHFLYDDFFSYLHEDGRPTLPFYSLELLIPFSTVYWSVSSVQVTTETIYLDYDYTPAQTHSAEETTLSYDYDYYNNYNDTWYWNEYHAEETGFGNHRGISFSFFPCHYEPSHRELTIVTEASYVITWAGGNLNNIILSIPTDDRVAFNYFDNYTRLDPEYVPPIDGQNYLIIAADEFLNDTALQRFKLHKEYMGYDVDIVYLYEIGYTPDNIRDYIKCYRNTYTLDYVLLVGDVQYIPFSAGSERDEYDPPTDIFYVCLDANTVSGQWYDITPDALFIGRWPIIEQADISNIVTKTISSELHLGHYNPNRIDIFTGSGNWDCYFNHSASYLYNNFVNNNDPDDGFDWLSGSLVDGRNISNDNAAHDSIQHYLSGIYGDHWIFIYEGHGRSYRISSPYFLTDEDIPYINTSNLHYQPFGFGFSCLLGNIYFEGNFARAWVTSENGGPAFYGATTASYMEPDRYMSRAIFRQLQNKKVMTIGEFVEMGAAKYYNADKVNYRRREAKKYVLYGDPSLYLYGFDFYNSRPHLKPDIKTIDSSNVELQSLLLNRYENIQSISIYSVSGQIVQKGTIEALNLQNLSSGLYVVVVNADDQQFTHKLIVK